MVCIPKEHSFLFPFKRKYLTAEPGVVCLYISNYMIPTQSSPRLQGSRKGEICNLPLFPSTWQGNQHTVVLPQLWEQGIRFLY